MSAIELQGAAKRFGDTVVLASVDLAVLVGSLTAVLGPSGCGKTTLLRLIAGFERLDAGRLTIGGRIVDDGRRTVAPQHRGVGYVPQEGALFPHLTVFANIAFGLRRRNRARAEQLLQLTGLESLRRRYPHQLSGGQQQRVALARALAIGPDVVLLDEPFSALDASLRTELRADVARILKDTGTTAVLVTHDQDEALALADQVALLSDGRMLASAEPRRLYSDPPDVRTAVSIGEANILAAELRDGHAICPLGSVSVISEGEPPRDGPAQLLLRPEQLALRHQDAPGTTRARVTQVQYHGHDALVAVQIETGDALVARVLGDHELAAGRDVWIEVVGDAKCWPCERPGGSDAPPFTRAQQLAPPHR